MIDLKLLSAAGSVLTAAGAILLYMSSQNQRLLRRRPVRGLSLIGAAALLIAGTTTWIAAWGGLVGGLISFLVWMTTSIALPYLFARRIF